MKVAVYTLGCKLNQCESEALASSFDSRGFFVGSVRDAADLYIINTCTVTSKAEQKARRMIRKLSSEHPESAVVVTGCYAQLDRDELELASNVIVVPHDYKDDLNRLSEHLKQQPDAGTSGIIPDLVRDFFTGNKHPANPDRFWYESVDFNYHTRAFLKIQDGCDNSCAYCRVTIARGESVSLGVDSVIRQFSALQEQGYREVVLTGVNLTSYNSGGIDFSRLLSMLTSVAEEASAPARIRVSSLEPETIDGRMADAVSHSLVCPHFHIPVQSGSDRILAAMRRHNNREKIINAVKTLRSVKSDPFFAADIIAGFPGETDEDFELSRSLLEECDFTHLHVFPFSPRPGTAAVNMKNPVPERVAGERTAILRKLSDSNYRRYAERWVGAEVDVLLEDEHGKNWIGTSGNYLKSTVCDIINDESGANLSHRLCRAVVGEVSGNEVNCRFEKWI